MEKSFGDYITTTDYNQYENILVLHSYDYFWPNDLKKRDKIWWNLDPQKVYKTREVYERKVGLELEKMNLPNVIVKQSPKQRNFKYLLETYKSRFVLDLHDIARDFKPGMDQPYCISHIYHRHNRKLEEYFSRFRKEYSLRKGTNGPIGQVENYGALYDNANPRSMTIELMTFAGKEKSLKFLKSLTYFLKKNDLYL